MTSTPVKGVNPLMNYVQTRQSAGTSDELAGNFTDAFSKASGQNGTQQMISQTDRVVQNASQARVNSDTVKKPERDNTVKKADTKPGKVQKPDMDEETENAVGKAGEELVEKVAEELGVPVEKVQEAMAELGLTMADLLNVAQMTQLVLNLEGADMLSLVTDEGLYQSLQNLLDTAAQTVQTLQSELGITEEELAAILEQAKAAEQAPEQEMSVQPKVEDGMEEDREPLPKGQKDYTVTVERNGEAVEISVKKDAHGKTEGMETTAEEIPEPGTEAVTKTEVKEDTAKHDTGSQHENGKETAQGNMLLEHLLNRENTAKTDTVFDVALSQRTADTQNIMNQIMDYMKVQVKADMTQMELQLHPASLGTVNINISSKEGVITAQFLTQNEAVKAAVESQIVQLKSSFEEQGLKVEAVEVAVENHSFERSLGGNAEGQEQTGGGKKKNARRINLNELNQEGESLLDDAEQIAVEMMVSDGNTVDYTA